MDLRLVFAESRNRRSEAVLPSAKFAAWQRGRQLRSSPARHQNSSQGAQGRLPSLRAQLLSPLPSRGASRRTRPHVGLSRRISLRRQETARVLIFVFALGQAQKAVPMSFEPRFHVGFRTSISLTGGHGRAGSRASRHPSSPRQVRAGVNLPSWEERRSDTGPRLPIVPANRSGFVVRRL